MRDEYKNVSGLSIMPYCITEEDIENEHLAISSRLRKFNKQGLEYVDYDGKKQTSGFNFHKHIKPGEPSRYQVVLVADGTSPMGPGAKKWIKPEEFLGLFPRKKRLAYVKKEWYFPTIQSDLNLLKANELYSLKSMLIQDIDAALITIMNPEE